MIINHNNRYAVEIVTWDRVKEDVRKCNTTLFSLIEALSPDKTLPLLKARYPFGAKIVDNGILQLPCVDGKLVPIENAELDKNFKEHLNYCSIPLSLLLNKDSEIFVETKKRVIPLQYIKQGQFFGLFESLSPYPYHIDDPKPIWHVTAGTRTIFMLPKISDAIGHNRLKKHFHLQRETPKNLGEHWHVFRELASHMSGTTGHWHSNILIFPKSWFEARLDNNAWLRFKNYLVELAWLEAQILREKSTFGYLWESFSSLTTKNFRTKPYFAESVKHLMLIAIGARPGYIPAEGNDNPAPIHFFENVYTDLYDLKHYPPILMHATRFSHTETDKCPIYYSLAYPTVLHHDVNLEQPNRTMPQLREIRRLMNIIQVRIQNMPTTAANLLKHITYSYYHSEDDPYEEIEHTNNIANSHRWQNILRRYPGKKFPISAPLLRGVIEISTQR